MAEITVRKEDKPGGWEFDVKVEEGDSTSNHRVKVSEDYYNKLATPDSTPEEFVEQSFHFLLSREPKESILSSFNITIISNYFPEYEDEIQRMI